VCSPLQLDSGIKSRLHCTRAPQAKGTVVCVRSTLSNEIGVTNHANGVNGLLCSPTHRHLASEALHDVTVKRLQSGFIEVKAVENIGWGRTRASWGTGPRGYETRPGKIATSFLYLKLVKKLFKAAALVDGGFVSANFSEFEAIKKLPQQMFIRLECFRSKS
jgi:hypothetical protein